MVCSDVLLELYWHFFHSFMKRCAELKGVNHEGGIKVTSYIARWVTWLWLGDEEGVRKLERVGKALSFTSYNQ